MLMESLRPSKVLVVLNFVENRIEQEEDCGSEVVDFAHLKIDTEIEEAEEGAKHKQFQAAKARVVVVDERG